MTIGSYKLTTYFIYMKPLLSKNGGMYSGVLYCVLWVSFMFLITNITVD